jgi:SAM-dependent methyltransferase
MPNQPTVSTINIRCGYERSMEKEGNFDWIISYEEVRSFFAPECLGFDLFQTPSRALVIGCGTSKMSEQISQDFQKCQVISVDNDEEVIQHMVRDSGYRMNLKWYRYDMIEDFAVPQENELDESGSYDLVIDKGTFDAILVEGATHLMLVDINRLLKVGGVYVLFSINTQELLQSLLSLPELSFELMFYANEKIKCTTLLCRKTSNAPVNVESLGGKEQVVLDQYFKRDNPLVTESFLRQLRQSFAENNGGDEGGYIRWELAHHMMFVANNQALCYSYDLFLEDVRNMDFEYDGLISLQEAIDFLKMMQ